MKLRFLALAALLASCHCHPSGSGKSPTPAGTAAPVAARRDHQVPSPHGSRNDPYYWLRDDTRKDPEVLAYLEAENAYAAAQLAPMKGDEQTLLGEIKGRISDFDETAPVPDGDYVYWERYEPGKQHANLYRRHRTDGTPEALILDRNARAAGHTFYLAGRPTPSPDGRYLAWFEDTVGRYQFVLRVKDLRSGELLPDTLANLEADVAWANDNRSLFVVVKDPTTLRGRYVTRHVLGTPASSDTVVHDEADETYYVNLGRTKSDRYVTIEMWSTLSTEVRVIDADLPGNPPRVFLPRERDHEYELDHDGARFIVHTNLGAKNFRIVEAPDQVPTDRAAWRDLVAHDPAALISDFAVYRDFIAWDERRGGLQRVKVLPRGRPAFTVEADDPTFVMSVHDTPDLTARAVRWSYESLTTPSTVYERDLATGERTRIDETPVPTYDASRYVTEYLHATAADGTAVPISLMRRKDLALDGTAPMLVYGYGSYGASSDPRFAAEEISLLDRGWVYAVAHVRGGSEMGRAWYEGGRQLTKMNTFTDFNSVTEHLIAKKYAAPDKVFALGGSAGGLLMGAIVNLRPDLYRGVIAYVPFVDVITTMLDASIPLTTNEYDEWGNPAQREVYDYMATYSPYDNVGARAYPSILVLTGLWDSQVQYFEPAKWVAKLRATRTDENLLVFETNMKAGHGGKTGRFDKAGEWAHRYAFFLHVLARPDARRGWPSAR